MCWLRFRPPVTHLGLAFVLFWRKPRDPMAIYASFFLLAYGVIVVGPLGMLEGSKLITESLTILLYVAYLLLITY